VNQTTFIFDLKLVDLYAIEFLVEFDGGMDCDYLNI